MTGPTGQPTEQPAYPIPRPPTADSDARFTRGLTFDVADVLTRHGYPDEYASQVRKAMKQAETEKRNSRYQNRWRES